MPQVVMINNSPSVPGGGGVGGGYAGGAKRDEDSEEDDTTSTPKITVIDTRRKRKNRQMNTNFNVQQSRQGNYSKSFAVYSGFEGSNHQGDDPSYGNPEGDLPVMLGNVPIPVSSFIG